MDESRARLSAPRRVLVVDDDPAAREMLTEQLAAGGHRAVTAANGREALDVLEDDRIELVILDLEMPVMDGWETRRRMRGHRRLAQIPTIILTGLHPRLPEALEAAAVVTKPIGLDDLLFLVDQVVPPSPSSDGDAVRYSD